MGFIWCNTMGDIPGDIGSTVNERLSNLESVEELVIALNQIREELLEGKLSL